MGGVPSAQLCTMRTRVAADCCQKDVPCLLFLLGLVYGVGMLGRGIPWLFLIFPVRRTPHSTWHWAADASISHCNVVTHKVPSPKLDVCHPHPEAGLLGPSLGSGCGELECGVPRSAFVTQVRDAKTGHDWLHSRKLNKRDFSEEQ